MGVPVMMAPPGAMGMAAWPGAHGGMVMVAPAPPGMAAAGGGAHAGGGMVPPQLMAMLTEAAKGGRSSNVFFKTRICNKCARRAGAGERPLPLPLVVMAAPPKVALRGWGRPQR